MLRAVWFASVYLWGFWVSRSGVFGKDVIQDDGNIVDSDVAGMGDLQQAVDIAEAREAGKSSVVDLSMFDGMPDKNKVYATSEILLSPIYNGVGFVRYCRVFGVPFVATAKVPEKHLEYGARMFASILDNNEDGVVDDARIIEKLLNFNIIIAYTLNEEDSQELWGVRIESPEGKAFKTQFKEHIHVFEQWSEEHNPAMHTIRQEVERTLANQFAGDHKGLVKALEKAWKPGSPGCAALVQSGFDWSLVHLLFCVTYYGGIEIIDPESRDWLQKMAERARIENIFTSEPDQGDGEILQTVLLMWVYVTKSGYLDCFIGQPDFQFWNLQTVEKIKAWEPKLIDFLDKFPGIPKGDISPNYNSSAIAIPSYGSEKADHSQQ